MLKSFLVFVLMISIQFLWSPFVSAKIYHAVIISKQEYKITLNQCSRSSPENVSDYWTPSDAEIQSMEAKMQQIVLLKSNRGSIKNLQEYVFQYVPIIMNGSKFIYINAFPKRDSFIEHLDKAIVVCDGGSSFWGVLYNVEKALFSDLAINGSA